jgi:trigger factor
MRTDAHGGVRRCRAGAIVPGPNDSGPWGSCESPVEEEWMVETENLNKDIRVECSETSSVLRSIRVEVDSTRVDRAFDGAYAQLQKTARVKGFRPGKVPRSVLERMYGASLPEEVERRLVGETLSSAIETAQVVPLCEPGIDAEPPQAGVDFRYTAEVEVKPEIELPDLSVLEGRKPIVLVGDDEVEAELERMRQARAALAEEKEGTAAAEGHTLTLDFEGRIDGALFDGGSAQGVDLELGKGAMIPGFEDQLIGVMAGDDRQLEVTFPEDYGPDELNGKAAVFDCHITAVRTRVLPELDAEFARDLGDFESLDEVRTRIHDDMEKRRDEEARRSLHRSLMDSLIGASEFEVPPGTVRNQLMHQMQSMHQQFHGRVPDEVLQEQLERMGEEGLPIAEKRVRELLLLDAVASAHGLEVSSEDVEARLAELAEAQGRGLDELRSEAEKENWLPQIEAELRERRVYAVLAEQATIVDVEPDPEQTESAP